MLDEGSIDRLLEADLLSQATGDEFAITESVRSELDRQQREIEQSGWERVRESVQTACESDGQIEQVLTALDNRPSRGARFLVLQSKSDFAVSECLQLTYLLEEFDRELPPTAGVPDEFMPIHADQIPLVLSLSQKAIVYIWKTNCDPCDTMCEEFESLFGEIEDEELGLYSLYGPDGSEFLHDRYNVLGAPTTLFFVNGEVDARLVGPHYRSVITSEIETLREIPA